MAKVNKNAGVLAARVAGEMAEMDAAMRRVRGAVEAEASKHRDTGAFQSSIESGRVRGRSGVTDRAVWTDAEDAWPIEFGHTTERGTEVPGKFIFSNAARRF